MHDLGDVVPLSVTVRDEAGQPADATSVALTITTPTQALVIDPVASAGSGVYEYAFPTTEVGRHDVRWVATGTNASAYTDSFDVDEWAGIIGLADAKRHLNIPATRTTNDEEMRLFVLSASELVERRIGYVARRAGVTEVAYPDGDGFLNLAHPVLSLTSVTGVYGSTAVYDAATLTAGSPELADRKVWLGAGWYGGRASLLVTYVAGLPVVPVTVRDAVKYLVKSLWESQRGGGNPAQAIAGGADLAEVEGMGLAVWRAEKMLEGLAAPVVA